MVIIECETGEHVEVAGDSLVNAALMNLNLHRALLDGQDLRDSDFSGSELRSAWMGKANFSNAIFNRSNLAACNASHTNFTFAKFINSLMCSGIYARADFTGAILNGAKVGEHRLLVLILMMLT